MMKKILIITFTVLFLGCIGAEAATTQPVKSTTPPPGKPLTPPPPVVQQQMVDFANCNKIFKIDSQKLLYLTLSSISANRFTINEIQTRSGYALFSVGQRQFLATIITLDAKNSMLKITPCDENYYFPIGIVQNCFKYIELNINTPVEKLNVS